MLFRSHGQQHGCRAAGGQCRDADVQGPCTGAERAPEILRAFKAAPQAAPEVKRADDQSAQAAPKVQKSLSRPLGPLATKTIVAPLLAVKAPDPCKAASLHSFRAAVHWERCRRAVSPLGTQIDACADVVDARESGSLVRTSMAMRGRLRGGFRYVQRHGDREIGRASCRERV